MGDEVDQMTEWRTCPSWPEYEVSDTGRIRRTVKRYGNIGERMPYLSTNGYLYIVMRHRKRRQALGIHRIVAEAFIGPAPSLLHQVAHFDGDRLNNHWSNLRYATRKENERDKLRHNRSNRGERCGHAKLTEETVRRIKEMLGDGQRNVDIAKRLCVRAGNVSQIKCGDSWNWLR